MNIVYPYFFVVMGNNEKSSQVYSNITNISWSRKRLIDRFNLTKQLKLHPYNLFSVDNTQKSVEIFLLNRYVISPLNTGTVLYLCFSNVRYGSQISLFSDFFLKCKTTLKKSSLSENSTREWRQWLHLFLFCRDFWRLRDLIYIENECWLF